MSNWSDHSYSCKKCRTVSIEKTATFANSCAVGAPLLMAEARRLAAPATREKQKAVEEWAKSTGAFTEFDAKSKQPPKYVGE